MHPLAPDVLYYIPCWSVMNIDPLGLDTSKYIPYRHSIIFKYFTSSWTAIMSPESVTTSNKRSLLLIFV